MPRDAIHNKKSKNGMVKLQNALNDEKFRRDLNGSFSVLFWQILFLVLMDLGGARLY